jgi:hypothetical protein
MTGLSAIFKEVVQIFPLEKYPPNKDMRPEKCLRALHDFFLNRTFEALDTDALMRTFSRSNR